MKRFITLLAVILLFSGGTVITGTQKITKVNPDQHFISSVDTLESAVRKLETASKNLERATQ